MAQSSSQQGHFHHIHPQRISPTIRVPGIITKTHEKIWGIDKGEVEIGQGGGAEVEEDY